MKRLGPKTAGKKPRAATVKAPSHAAAKRSTKAAAEKRSGAMEKALQAVERGRPTNPPAKMPTVKRGK